MALNKLMTLAALAIALALTAPKAQAHGYPHHPHPGEEDLTAMVLLSGSFSMMLHTLEHNHHYKLAVLDAQPAAVGVLNGGAADDLFRSGREALEAIAKGHFVNDTEAAIAILEFGEVLRNGEKQ